MPFFDLHPESLGQVHVAAKIARLYPVAPWRNVLEPPDSFCVRCATLDKVEHEQQVGYEGVRISVGHLVSKSDRTRSMTVTRPCVCT